MKPRVIAIVGSKKVGKTTTTENLIKQLTQRGYKVAAIKHISEPNWTIDTEGKDTWKFARAGAKTIIAVAADEIDTIEKVRSEKISLESLIDKARDSDIIVVEGLKQQAAKNPNIPKIVITTTREQAEKAVQTYSPIIAFSGPFSTVQDFPQYPYVDGQKNPDKLADVIEKHKTK